MNAALDLNLCEKKGDGKCDEPPRDEIIMFLVAADCANYVCSLSARALNDFIIIIVSYLLYAFARAPEHQLTTVYETLKKKKNVQKIEPNFYESQWPVINTSLHCKFSFSIFLCSPLVCVYKNYVI